MGSSEWGTEEKNVGAEGDGVDGAGQEQHQLDNNVPDYYHVLTRRWSFQEYSEDLARLTMTLDASPWGLGGVLQLDDRLISWFSSPLTRHGERIHKRRIGCAKGQQVWECLCFLVALRVWKEFWADRKLSITIRSDNLAALFLGAQMKFKASALVAKEVALEYSDTSFEPRILSTFRRTGSVACSSQMLASRCQKSLAT